MKYDKKKTIGSFISRIPYPIRNTKILRQPKFPVKQNTKILRQNKFLVKRNTKILRQNKFLVKRNTKILRQNKFLVKRNTKILRRSSSSWIRQFSILFYILALIQIRPQICSTPLPLAVLQLTIALNCWVILPIIPAKDRLFQLLERPTSLPDIFGVCLNSLRTKLLIDDASKGMASKLLLFGITGNLYG